jgi:hypothetical protein
VQESAREGAAPLQPPSALTEPQAPIQVEMTLTSQSWLRITADGDKEFEGILQPGETRLWTADQALTIRAGNAGGSWSALTRARLKPGPAWHGQRSDPLPLMRSLAWSVNPWDGLCWGNFVLAQVKDKGHSAGLAAAHD